MALYFLSTPVIRTNSIPGTIFHLKVLKLPIFVSIKFGSLLIVSFNVAESSILALNSQFLENWYFANKLEFIICTVSQKTTIITRFGSQVKVKIVVQLVPA